MIGVDLAVDWPVGMAIAFTPWPTATNHTRHAHVIGHRLGALEVYDVRQGFARFISVDRCQPVKPKLGCHRCYPEVS